MSTRRQRRSREADWSAELQEIERRRELGKKMGGPEKIARQHEFHKLTIRERIDGFLDTGSFQEIGVMAGSGVYENGELTDFNPAAFVTGLGSVDGRLVAVGGEDFTLSGGSGGGGHKGPSTFMQPFAKEYRIPLVQFADGAGASAKTYEDEGRMMLPDGNMWTPDVELLGMVPVVSAVVGSAAGHVAGRAALCHFSVMTKGSGQIFAAGPPVVKRALGEDVTKDELGGTDVHVVESGVIDNEAIDEADAFRQIRAFLSYMPNSVWETPLYRTPTDDPERREERLATLIPRERNRAYDMRELIGLVVDDGEFFEMRRAFGSSLLTCFARLNGYVVGIIANDPQIYAGAMTRDGADKMTHFVDLCNAFNIPVVLFVDVPGFMIGSAAERSGVMRAGMRAVMAATQAVVPHIAMQVRKSYGMAGDAASAVGGAGATKLRFGWPSGEWGAIPIEGGVAAAYRRVIESADDPDAKRQELEERMVANRNPFKVAEAMEVLDIIDPRETRPLLCKFIQAAQPKLAQITGRTGGVRP
ncbi:MAG TPA: carboxyl transferase domain-containing protein [Dehalococcoidia bacterium]|nr:carboxyl transferase domain-containing protein [Dehalococcoidia bacterium]